MDRRLSDKRGIPEHMRFARSLARPRGAQPRITVTNENMRSPHLLDARAISSRMIHCAITSRGRRLNTRSLWYRQFIARAGRRRRTWGRSKLSPPRRSWGRSRLLPRAKVLSLERILSRIPPSEVEKNPNALNQNDRFGSGRSIKTHLKCHARVECKKLKISKTRTLGHRFWLSAFVFYFLWQDKLREFVFLYRTIW